MRYRPQQTSFVPLWQWRGARPRLLDLDENQAGSLLCLLLVRDGDCCLLPLAWRYEQVAVEPRDPLQPTLPFAQAAIDGEAMRLAQSSLEQDGWRVSGRLDLHFHGLEATAHFWRQIETFLSASIAST